MRYSIFVAALATVILAGPATAGAIKYRDPQGRVTGSMSRDSQNTRTYRDGQGRTTSRCSTDTGGTVVCYDAQGRVISRSSR